ncbi:MAG: hypothetical protein ACSLFI_12015 [Solirubrobacterales bacterium]
MTEQEARDRCKELARSSPERTSHSWLPREGAGGFWTIVKLGVPSTSQATGTLAASEVQAIKDDPRNIFEKNVPPNGAAFGA